MQFIKEQINDVQVLTESVEGVADKNMYVEGIFLQGGIKNRNGRIYPVDVLDEKTNSYVREYVATNRAFGELGHTNSPNITLERVSHIIVSLVKDGNDWIGKAKILDTPMGVITKNLINGGSQLGVSSRALGSLKEEGGANVVQNDLVICTAADIVADPSAPDAFVQAIMEGKTWMLVDNKYTPQDLEESIQRIEKTSSRNLQEQFIKEFDHFMKRMGAK
jgi:hypothetical protein